MTDRTAPTIGRVVLFFNDKGQLEPHRADVCAVYADGKVNLSVNGADGESYTMVNVPLIQGDDEKPAEGGWCEWMQYQVKQHAKHKAEDELPQYQQRVITERLNLDAIIVKLGDFISSKEFSGLDRNQRNLLISQKMFMHGYSAVLGQRISSFDEFPKG